MVAALAAAAAGAGSAPALASPASPAALPTLSGQLVIAGTVTFTVNGAPAGTARLSASGVAIVIIKSIRRLDISASYSGDDHFLSSTGRFTRGSPSSRAGDAQPHRGRAVRST